MKVQAGTFCFATPRNRIYKKILIKRLCYWSYLWFTGRVVHTTIKRKKVYSEDFEFMPVFGIYFKNFQTVKNINLLQNYKKIPKF